MFLVPQSSPAADSADAQKLFFFSPTTLRQEWVNNAAFEKIVHFKVCGVMRQFQGNQNCALCWYIIG